MSRLLDGEDRSILDYFASVMDFLSRDKILIPFSYGVVALGVCFGAYQIYLRENPKLESETLGNLEAIVYSLPRQR